MDTIACSEVNQRLLKTSPVFSVKTGDLLQLSMDKMYPDIISKSSKSGQTLFNDLGQIFGAISSLEEEPPSREPRDPRTQNG